MSDAPAPAKTSPAAAAKGPTQPWTGGHNPWLIALTVTMATFMEVLDTSIANVSLPHIAGNLSVTVDESTWVLTSYLVSNAIVLPISGWLSTKIGRKRFYMGCVLLFTISSFLCGIAPNLGALIFFRIIQGLGGGGLGPSEQAILADTFEPKKRGVAFAVYGMAVVLAPAIGPTLGGYITDHYSWRWIFFINVPVGLLSLYLSNKMVSDPPHLKEAKKRAGSIDYVGLGLIAVGLGALEIVLDKGQEDDWFSSHFIVGCSLVAGFCLVSFVVWEWQQEHPIVEVKLFKNRNFAAANAMMLALGIALFGSTVLLPQYMQVIMGYSAQQAGMVLSPGGVAIVLLMPMIGQLISRVDTRYMIGFGFSLLSVSLFYMAAHLYPGVDFGTLVRLRVFQVVGLAFLFVPINTIVYNGVPNEKNNAVSGIVNLSRNMGGDIGIALVTTYLIRHSQFHQGNLVRNTTAYNLAFTQRLAEVASRLEHAGSSASVAAQQATGIVYRQLLGQAQTLAYLDTLRLLAIITGLMIPLVFLTRRPKGGPQMGH